MNDHVALIIALLIVSAIGADYFLADFTYSIFMSKKFLAFTDYIAFWR